jgi:hypothetical protein
VTFGVVGGGVVPGTGGGGGVTLGVVGTAPGTGGGGGGGVTPVDGGGVTVAGVVGGPIGIAVAFVVDWTGPAMPGVSMTTGVYDP